MKKERVLVIEDEEDIREVVEYNLAREGYDVLTCRDGERGLAIVKTRKPDLILLDLLLPGIDGIEICRRLKQDPETLSVPIIMLTAKGEESDVVLGLGLGADDYIKKPFSLRELVARVRAVLRRGKSREKPESPKRVACGELEIDLEERNVRYQGEAIPFTGTELRLLFHLASRPGRVFSREVLLEHIIEGNARVIARNVDVHVRSIRKKLGAARRMIETVRGVGYRFR
ncbi:MAG: response regulator, partial [Planctomycetes bacterium]|nr:response regulator [Planctomycetota bacterium]